MVGLYYRPWVMTFESPESRNVVSVKHFTNRLGCVSDFKHRWGLLHLSKCWHWIVQSTIFEFNKLEWAPHDKGKFFLTTVYKVLLSNTYGGIDSESVKDRHGIEPSKLRAVDHLGSLLLCHHRYNSLGKGLKHGQSTQICKYDGSIYVQKDVK